MKQPRSSLAVAVLSAILIVAVAPSLLVGGHAAAAATCTSVDVKVGLTAIPGGSLNDGCDIHHVLSQQALRAAGIPVVCWPVINIPQDPDHRETRNNSRKKGSPGEREKELINIQTMGLLAAFDQAWSDFIADMSAINSPFVGQYNGLYQTLRNLLIDAINKGPCKPKTDPNPGGPPSGSAGATVQNYPQPQPVPNLVPQNSPIAASATGVGAVNSGITYDLILADSAQLACDPYCNNSPVMLSGFRVAVDSTGNLPSSAGRLGSLYWESGGEQDGIPPALGSAQLCFAQSSDHHASSTTPVALTIGPPSGSDAPAISPQTQVTASDGLGLYSVTAPQDPNRATTLSFCYGDGACEPNNTIPQGSGTSRYSFSHTFPPPTSVYTQTATIVETGASSTSVTTAGSCGGSCGGGGGGGGGVYQGTWKVCGDASATCVTSTGTGVHTFTTSGSTSAHATLTATVTVTATGLKASPATYTIRYNNPTGVGDGVDCMSSVIIGGPVTTSATGGFGPNTYTLGAAPTDAGGVAAVCVTEVTLTYLETGSEAPVTMVT